MNYPTDRDLRELLIRERQAERNIIEALMDIDVKPAIEEPDDSTE